MKGLIFLVVTLAVSSAFSNGLQIVEIGNDKDGKKGLLDDDILEAPNIQRTATADDARLWTSPVPFVLNKDLEMNAKGVILQAMEQFRLKSCIDFRPSDSEAYYINFQNSNKCSSYIGKVKLNGQAVKMGSGCDDLSTAEHEILHALGFYHEQARFDRDDYVTIVYENIIKGKENNFEKKSEEDTTTNGTPYDYFSVMHYEKDAFTNGNGSTIVTKDPKFQDVIGQRLEMSAWDVLELNLRYRCNSTIAFNMHCSFSNGTMCEMNRCSNGSTWEMVTSAYGGPSSDHTNLPSGNRLYYGEDAGYFMHVSTASGMEGDSALLVTKRMSPSRKCHIQCLQFYYYHNGSKTDVLNIWIREFQNETWDIMGTRRLMGQITGPPKPYWHLHYVSLNASKHFQVEFEVRKGAGSSFGGFAIDDINLSETECPHFTWQLDDFENLLTTSDYGTVIYSPQQSSSEGYTYRFGIILFRSFVGSFVQLLSGKYDDQLKWPMLQRQVTFQMLDQNPNLLKQMSKRKSITSDLTLNIYDGKYLWGNPREIGYPFVDENNEIIYGGSPIGSMNFASLEEMRSRDFLKGDSLIFTFNFQDLTPLVNGSDLPCPQVGPVKITHSPQSMDKGPCLRISPTSLPPPKTTDDRILPTGLPPPKSTDDSIFGFCPGMVASPVLTLLLALMLLIP